MKYIVAILVTVFMAACSGYKPLPQYSSELFKSPVIVKVKLDPEDPASGVYLQDTISQFVTNRLNLAITKDVNKASNYIVVNDYTINTSPANYDKNGNVVRYSVNAAIVFAVKDKKGFWSKNIVANEYVDVAPKAALATNDKDKAAKVAINRALDDFMVAIVKRSQKLQKEEEKAQKQLKDANKSDAASNSVSYGTQEGAEQETNATANRVGENSSIESAAFEPQESTDPLAQLR